MKANSGTLMLAVSLLARGVYAQVAPPQPQSDDSWQNLYQVMHARIYTVMDRDGNCTIGEIRSVTEQNLVIKEFSSRANTVTLARSDLLRITDGNKPIDVVFSGRSSWSDVKNLTRIGSDETVVVALKDGRRYRGKPVDASETEIGLAGWNKAIRIPKESVAKVYYVREKPMSASTEHSAQELFLFDPTLWPYLLHVPPKISVLLYDSLVPESNAQIKCKNSS